MTLNLSLILNSFHNHPFLIHLFQVIKYGFPSFDPNYEGKMLGNDSLSEDEVWQLITYIRQEWPVQIQDVYNSRYE